jgi:hypothetical protein
VREPPSGGANRYPSGRTGSKFHQDCCIYHAGGLQPQRSGRDAHATRRRGRPFDFTQPLRGKIMKKLSMLCVILGASVVCAAPISFHWSPANTLSLSVDKADARVGRPLTPMSVAGVNRRVHRRAYYGAYAHPGYARPLCGYAPYPPCY